MLQPTTETPAARQTRKHGVSAVEQACLVLFALADQEHERTIRELSEDLGISKSTIQRIVASLEEGGLLTLDPVKQKYSLSYRVLSLASSVSRRHDLISRAMPFLEWLGAESGETVTLSTVCDNTRVTILQIESRHELRYATEMGRLYPLVIGATGHTLLARMTAQRLDQTLALYEQGQTAASGSGVASIDYAELRERIQQVRERGYDETHSEWVPGGVGLAVPLLSPGSEPYALGIYGPADRMTPELISKCLEALRQAARQITAPSDSIS